MNLTSSGRIAICAIAILCHGCSNQPGDQAASLLGAAANTNSEQAPQSLPAPHPEPAQPAVIQQALLDSRTSRLTSDEDENRAQLPAFPGAEGFGAFSKGGRGDGSTTPRVIAVTTLADRVFNAQTGQWRAAPGSLREAVEASGPRFVVFRVAGTIFLDTKLYIDNPYITIAGQTAPGFGIALGHQGVAIRTHDVVLRHLRVRILFEDLTDWAVSGSMEGMVIYNNTAPPPATTAPATNVIIDHCSISWSTDQNFTVWHWARDFTIQWSIISESALYGMFAGVGSYGVFAAIDTGAPVPDDFARGTMHHNLIAHNQGRNSAIYTGSSWDYRNNVVYNWNMIGACDFKGSKDINFVGNVYFPGIDTGLTPQLRRTIRTVTPSITSKFVPRLFINDNYTATRVSSLQPQWDIGVVQLAFGDVCGGAGVCEIPLTAGLQALVALSQPANTPAVTTDSSISLIPALLTGVGASRPVRDTVDGDLINELDYVNRAYTPASIIPTTDGRARKCGPHHGPVVNVLFFDPTNDPGYSCGPRQYRMAPGESLEIAKYNMLSSRICTFPDGLTLPHDLDLILADPVTYPFHVEQVVIPDRATTRSLYPEITTPVTLPDSDGDGIPNIMEIQIGSNPLVSDAFGDANKDGYSNFEEYLNLLAQ